VNKVNVKDLIKEGRLEEARNILVYDIRKSPGDIGLRTLFFLILSFYGEWEKASRQLDAATVQSTGVVSEVEVYKQLIEGEIERSKVVRMEALPSFLPEEPEYFYLYREALLKIKNNEPEDAHLLYDKINEGLDNVRGTLNGKKFTRFSNPDAFLTYFLEIFVHGHHIYVPFENIRELLVTSPKNYFDLIWPQATLTTFSGLSMNCFLPAIYPESYAQVEDTLKMGRVTDWLPLCGNFVKGIGQQIFDVNGREVAVLEIRELHFDV
jgi:type VI secretion system protein ImpE